MVKRVTTSADALDSHVHRLTRVRGYQPTERPGINLHGRSVIVPPRGVPRSHVMSKLSDDDLADIGARLRRIGLEDERRKLLRERLLARQLDSTPFDRRLWLVLGFGCGFAAALLATAVIAAVLG